MPAGRQELRFDILADDRASRAFTEVGRRASAASDDVMGLSRRLDEVGKKNAQARVGLKGDKEALLQLDKMDARMLVIGRRLMDPRITVEGAAKAALELRELDLQMDKLSARSAEAETAAGSGGLAGPSGLGALIGAGVALSPVIATLGTGLAGFGLAAGKTLAPVLKSKDGITGLDSAQRQAYGSLQGLKGEVGQFTRALEPAVVTTFGKAVGLAGNLLHDVQPVAAATGRAFGQVVSAINADLKTAEWQDLFAFMSKTAGPDMRQLGAVIIDVANDLPPLLEDLQPLARGLLTVSDSAAKLIGGVEKLHLDLPLLGAGIGLLVGGPMGALIGAGAGAAASLATLGGKAGEVRPVLVKTAGGAEQVTAAVARFGPVAGTASRKLSDVGSAARGAGAGLHVAVQSMKDFVAEEHKLLGEQISTSAGIIAMKSDAVALGKAMHDSGGKIGYSSQKARDAQTAFNQLASDTDAQAQAAIKAGHATDAQRRALDASLSALAKAAGSNRALRTEVAELRREIENIPTEHTTRLNVLVNYQPGSGIPVLHAPGAMPKAAGGLITGGVPGRDSVLAALMPGEVVVPRGMVRSGEVDHLRGRLPGFAAGGQVPRYAPPGITVTVNDTGRPAAPAARTGPVIGTMFGGDLVIRERADVNLIAQKVSWAITASGF